MKARIGAILISLLLVACSGNNFDIGPTIADLSEQAPIIETIILEPKVKFDIDRQQVINSYRELLDITTNGGGNGDELRRLADLELEASLDNRLADETELQQQGQDESLHAISTYERYLQQYPHRADNDMIMYQLSRAYALESEIEKSLVLLNRIASDYPESRFIDEVEFRRGEYYFAVHDYELAEQAYGNLVTHFPDSIYYDKAMYKYGWSQFKQSQYEAALASFLLLLDLNLQAGNISEIGYNSELSRGEKELIADVVRVASLTFSYQDDRLYIASYFNENGKRDYEPLLYEDMAQLYLSQNRLVDGTDLYLSFTREYPFSPHAASFHQRAIEIYQQLGYNDLLLKEKIAYANKYDIGSDYWNLQQQPTQLLQKPILRDHLDELATYFHAKAGSSKKASDYQQSISWYRRYLKSFPDDTRSARMNFLLAENLYESGAYQAAVSEYEKTAYAYPAHDDNAEAGYAAIITYDRLLLQADSDSQAEIGQKRIESAVRFTTRFPGDRRGAAVEIQTAQQYFKWQNYSQASAAAKRLVNNPDIDIQTRTSAWTIIADAEFISSDYVNAELSYFTLSGLLVNNAKERSKAREQVAASIYKQGELARDAGNHQQAAIDFTRLGKLIPESPKRIVADYDAATAYLQLKDWPAAIKQLETFRNRYPDDTRWVSGVSEKLALAYSENGDFSLAAKEVLVLSSLSKPGDRKRDLMWRSAELYQQAGDEAKAIEIYKRYVKSYPYPLERSLELRFKIAQFHRSAKDKKKLTFWLKEIVKADARAGAERSPRSRYLAATSSLELIEPMHQQYQETKLTVPLKSSLAKKKKLMQRSLDAYSKAIKYQVAEVTTEATYQIAEIYHEFAKSLLKSERPRGLDEEQLEEYDLLLEEQAFPFEEKAIDIHLTNFQRIPTGVYDQPIRKSLDVLGVLMPFRYARAELSDIYVDIE